VYASGAAARLFLPKTWLRTRPLVSVLVRRKPLVGSEAKKKDSHFRFDISERCIDSGVWVGTLFIRRGYGWT